MPKKKRKYATFVIKIRENKAQMPSTSTAPAAKASAKTMRARESDNNDEKKRRRRAKERGEVEGAFAEMLRGKSGERATVHMTRRAMRAANLVYGWCVSLRSHTRCGAHKLRSADFGRNKNVFWSSSVAIRSRSKATLFKRLFSFFRRAQCRAEPKGQARQNGRESKRPTTMSPSRKIATRTQRNHQKQVSFFRFIKRVLEQRNELRVV